MALKISGTHARQTQSRTAIDGAIPKLRPTVVEVVVATPEALIGAHDGERSARGAQREEVAMAHGQGEYQRHEGPISAPHFELEIELELELELIQST